MFIKVCGITNEEDALMAVGLGADALGFVFAPSSRQVTPGTARDIVKRLPPEVLTIGVFRDQSPAEVTRTVLAAGLTGAQLHGHETPKDAQEVRRAAKVLFVAFPAGDPGLAHVDDYQPDAVVLDAPAPGSGHVFDWSLAESIPIGRRVILAGGLDPAERGRRDRHRPSVGRGRVERGPGHRRPVAQGPGEGPRLHQGRPRRGPCAGDRAVRRRRARRGRPGSLRLGRTGRLTGARGPGPDARFRVPGGGGYRGPP